MNLRIVLAMGNNREIGAKGELLWSLPDDLKHFREKTKNKPVIMGRKTFASIGKPLPQRTNIVVTRNEEYTVENVLIAHSLEQAITLATEHADNEICIIGGGAIVEAALPLATHMSLTFVDGEFPEADAFFPEVDWDEWRETSREHHEADQQHAYAFDFVEYERMKNPPRRTSAK